MKIFNLISYAILIYWIFIVKALKTLSLAFRATLRGVDVLHKLYTLNLNKLGKLLASLIV